MITTLVMMRSKEEDRRSQTGSHCVGAVSTSGQWQNVRPWALHTPSFKTQYLGHTRFSDTALEFTPCLAQLWLGRCTSAIAVTLRLLSLRIVCQHPTPKSLDSPCASALERGFIF